MAVLFQSTREGRKEGVGKGGGVGRRLLLGPLSLCVQGTNLRRLALDLTLTRLALNLCRSRPWNAMVNWESCIS